jgi:hypothetical protein
MTTSGATDAKYFRWKGSPSYGFGLHFRAHPLHRVPDDVPRPRRAAGRESLRLSAETWEALCRDFLT